MNKFVSLTLFAVVQATQDCPEDFEIYDYVSGMCESDGWFSDTYWCPGANHEDNPSWLDYVQCPGLGCGNWDENYCCPTDNRDAWTCNDERSWDDNLCSSWGGCTCVDTKMYITAARVTGEIEQEDIQTNSLGACCELGSENCGVTTSFNAAETMKFIWTEETIDYGLTIGSQMKVDGNAIYINDGSFMTELTGTINNGDEIDGTTMEVSAQCTSSTFYDPFTYISIEQEIKTMRVPLEVDYTLCGLTGTLQVSVEQTQRSSSTQCNSTSCGPTQGCNQETGCTDEQAITEPTTLIQLNENLTSLPINQEKSDSKTGLIIGSCAGIFALAYFLSKKFFSKQQSNNVVEPLVENNFQRL